MNYVRQYFRKVIVSQTADRHDQNYIPRRLRNFHALLLMKKLELRERSKGARSFRGQNILEPGHPDTLFPQKSWRPF